LSPASEVPPAQTSTLSPSNSESRDRNVTIRRVGSTTYAHESAQQATIGD
jgi:hypothetical protein